MAAQSNGRAKKPKASTPNGHMNGHANGHIDKSSAVARPSPRGKPKRSITASLTSLMARIATWYLIVTFAFRCPSSITQLSDSSPKICSPYLHARSYAIPYLEPYYQTYIKPQVQKVQPYIDRFDSQVYTPVASFTKDKYAVYGAHRVENTQKYLENEWDRKVQPQLQHAQTSAWNQYDQHLGPYVNQASDAVSPYYEQIKGSLVEIYHLSILPAYEAVLPYSKQAYAYGNYVVSRIVFPYVRSAKDTSLVFLTRTLWPQVRVLYGDNVEPQLVRISERLGRYKDQRKIEAAVDAVESEMTATSEATTTPEVIPTSAASAKTASSSGWNVLDNLWPAEPEASTQKDVKTQSQTPTIPSKPTLTGAELRASLNNDLRQWQSKFATAADKGAEDLEQRVGEITRRQVENGVKGHGAALVVQLEEASQSTIEKFKQFIIDTVKSVSEESTEAELEAAYETCIGKTRELGITVKDKAQAVRTWKVNYDQETDNLVRSAVESTVAVLDRIHGLGLQEVGMRWAWTDYVTHQDWKNYHKLKDTLSEWQAEVEAVGSSHQGLRVAHEEAKKLEDDAMAIASKMVNELVRLKEVARWKIWANDDTNDFSDKKVPVRVFKAAKEVVSSAGEVSSKASEAILGSETPASQSIASAIKENVIAASSKVSESIIGSETPAVESVASRISESVFGSETPLSQKVASSVKEQAASASSKVVEASSDASEAVAEGGSAFASSAADATDSAKSAANIAKESVASAASSATEAPKKVLGGVMAQVLVEAREIVFEDQIDDEETYSQKLQSIVAEAGDHAADLTRAVSEALLGPTKTQGSVESVTSLAGEQYERALSAASSVLYGTEQRSIESVTSVASEKFAAAVTAASYAIYGTPTPTAIYKTIHIEASSRYADAVSLANAQLSNAKAQLSELVSGTPKPAHETLLSMVEKAYSDSVAVANEKLQAALQYTDSVKSYAAGPTQGYFESVSSIASSRLSEGLSVASAQFSSKPTPALEGARRQYYEAIGLAHARYSDFLGAASSAVYGPQQGSIESIASVASASAASLASQVSSGVVGTETPWAESVASGISGSARSAASALSESAQSVGSKVGEAAEQLASQASSTVIGSETPWTESVASQASQNWEALIAKASSQVYGAPTPWAESIYSQAGAYGAQATAQAGEQYSAVSALISELVIGKEPDFTESVLNRFSSAYYTGLAGALSSVNSFANGNYEAASSFASGNYDAATSYIEDAYASASSVVSSVFTPPAAIETILSQASEQIEAAVESASVAVYGTPKGRVEEAGESIANAYASVQSKASEALYGTQQAQDSFTAVAASAQAAISAAIFGTPSPTGYVASVTEGAESVYSSFSSAASERAAEAAAALSSAIYGPEQGAIESASNRVAAAVEAANSRISEMYANAAKSAGDVASSASSAAAYATERIKDEL